MLGPPRIASVLRSEYAARPALSILLAPRARPPAPGGELRAGKARNRGHSPLPSLRRKRARPLTQGSRRRRAPPPYFPASSGLFTSEQRPRAQEESVPR